MKCNNCKRELSHEMRHSLVTNTCPFCGKGVLSDDDFMIRNSISKILIRRGIESEDQIGDITSDIIRLIRIDRVTGHNTDLPVAPGTLAGATAQAMSNLDGQAKAPSYVNESTDSAPHIGRDPISEAINVFEKQNQYPSESEDGGPSEEDIEVAEAEGVLFSNQRNDKAERLKIELAKTRAAGGPAYKSKPISRIGE